MYHIWKTLCHRAVVFLEWGDRRWKRSFTQAGGKSLAAFSSTKSEPVLAWMEQRLPKHSGNFSQAVLLKGYFFLFVLSHSISQVLRYYPPSLS